MATVEEIAKDTVEMNRSGASEEAGDKHWADDVVSKEPMDGPMARIQGKAAVKAKGDWWFANHEVHSVEAEGPYIHGDQFIVKFKMDVTVKESGQRLQMEEMGLYTVKDGKIAEESFFFGAQG